MKIQQAQVHLHAAHQLQQQDAKQESLRVWVDDPPDRQPVARDRFTLSAAAAAPPAVDDDEAGLDPRLQAMQRILEFLTGRKITVSNLRIHDSGPLPTPSSSQSQTATADVPAKVGWGLSYDATVSHTEQESITVTAAGTLVTLDGQKIAFSVNLTMDRSFTQTETTRIRAGDAKLVDPLVINFNGTAAQLTDLTFAFDLNSDGVSEQMPLLGANSGFLVLDRNGDSQVNNGQELFGPATGNGFAELARLDSDKNGWLDEGDQQWQALKVWTRDLAGNDYLDSLHDRGVGAILLKSVSSPFSLTDASGVQQGAIRESSIFVGEQGGAGTVQEVDLVV
ncbi:MAG: hypothetical protein AUK28_08375 [Desulfobacterales bacterium CG2_30_60_27]|nr:MAG: hypothetical protein AUK28_08375 [Desulfobacterales bacterium CG2_30_60_27]